MRFDILTLFPTLVDAVLQSSILGNAQENGFISVHTHQIRDYSTDKNRRVDDTPYGGGKGMVMQAEPIYRCYTDLLSHLPSDTKKRVIYLSPQGKTLTQQAAKRLCEYDNLILLCGHYEGVDQRLLDTIVDEEISIGNYVLTGGELPACVLVDCVARLIPGVLADPICHKEETFSYNGILEYPQYTHPLTFLGQEVPQVLREGDHAKIEAWRLEAALQKTKEKRPDLL